MADGRVSGKVHAIGETATFGTNGFRKREVVLEQDNGRFTSYIPVDFIQDGCDSVDSLKIGDEAEITFTLTGRKWQKDEASSVRYFLNAQASSFKVLGSQAVYGEEGGSQASPDDDDVPF